MIVCHKATSLKLKNLRYFSTVANKRWDLLSVHKTYDPKAVEGSRVCQDLWKRLDVSNPETRLRTDPHSRVFSMCLPPPNVTGDLHLGHALAFSIQDMIARWHRMQGAAVLWVPGLDHAGIATQSVVEKNLLAEEGRTRHQLGRSEFINRVGQWKDRKESIIKTQMNSLGLSVDWSREFFTLSPELSTSVTEAFVRLHEAGKLYRARRLVHWSCQLRSVISDIEVDQISIKGATLLKVPGYSTPQQFGLLHTITYPLVSTQADTTSHATLSVATTRLETVLGDTALAVHPTDNRYAHLIGRFAKHPLIPGRLLRIVGDDLVNPAVGTGVVKVTPGHSQIDFEIGERHQLDFINILDDSGCLTDAVGPQFAGLPRFEAREKVLSVLKQIGLYEGCSVEYETTLPMCSRSGDVVEPVLRDQWYLRFSESAQKAADSVSSGSLVLTPSEHNAMWKEWLTKNPRDWCVSRQLWWGHRIPAYSFRDKDQERWVVARNIEEAKLKASQELNCSIEALPDLKQDEDVLDTWFSSALLPFSIFGWPQKTEALDRFFPTSLLETGHDILFFWVARMVTLSLELTGQLPFKEVLLHGLICDPTGKKMSKSKANVVDPMALVAGVGTVQKDRLGQGMTSFGADALRFSLLSHHWKEEQVNFNSADVANSTKFTNKIWQSARFLQMHINITPPFNSDQLSITEKINLLAADWNEYCMADRWLLIRLSQLLSHVENYYESRDLHMVALDTRTFWWQDLCDVYLELIKPRLKDQNTSASSLRLLSVVMECSIRLLHPIMPHITEAVWQNLFAQNKASHETSLALQSFPHSDWFTFTNGACSTTTLEEMSTALKSVSLVREWRRVLRLSKGATSGFRIDTDTGLDNDIIDVLMSLTRLSVVNDNSPPTDNWLELKVHPKVAFIAEKEKCSLKDALDDLGSRLATQERKREETVANGNKKGVSTKRTLIKLASVDDNIASLCRKINELKNQFPNNRFDLKEES